MVGNRRLELRTSCMSSRRLYSIYNRLEGRNSHCNSVLASLFGPIDSYPSGILVKTILHFESYAEFQTWDYDQQLFQLRTVEVNQQEAL